MSDDTRKAPIITALEAAEARKAQVELDRDALDAKRDGYTVELKDLRNEIATYRRALGLPAREGKEEQA